MRSLHVGVLVVAACHAAPRNQVAMPTTTASASARTPPPKPLVIAETFGGYGCRGWSPTQGIALCFVGSTAAGSEPEVTAQFIALDDQAQPPADLPITLVDPFPNVATAKIPADALAKLREATQRFVTSWTSLDTFDGMDGRIRAGRVEVIARGSQTDAGGENAAPRYRVDLLVRSDKESAIDQIDGAISGYSVTTYIAGRTVLIERSYSIADEGQYERHVEVFVLAAPDRG
jgi:hypothetical protein